MIRPGPIVLILTMTLCAACTPLRPQRGAPVSEAFALQLTQGWQEQADQIGSVQGLAKFELEAPMTHLQGTQVLLVEKPDRLRAEALSPFGFPTLTLTSSNGRLGVHLVPQNLYYTGTANRQNLGEFIHVPLPPRDLVALLLYSPVLIDAWKEEAFALQEGGWIVLRYGSLLRQELIFDAARQLAEMAFYQDNDLQFKVEYAQFTHQAPLYPTRLHLELPEKYATINLQFSDPAVNQPIRSGVFDVAPPAGAKVVYLPH
ncbi:MAG: hypothetical protein P8Y73_04395 [Desulfuromonadales bacterium]